MPKLFLGPEILRMEDLWMLVAGALVTSGFEGRLGDLSGFQRLSTMNIALPPAPQSLAKVSHWKSIAAVQSSTLWLEEAVLD